MNSGFNNKTILANNPYIVVNSQGKTFPHFELNKTSHVLGRDSQFADLVLPQNLTLVSRVQASFRFIENNYYIYDGNAVSPSKNRLFVNNKLILPDEGYLLKDGDEIHVGQNPANLTTITYYNPNENPHNYQNLDETSQNSISLLNKSVLLGRDNNANLQLNAPTVSRRHAIIDHDGKGSYILKDLSTNGVFVNESKVNGSIRLNNGDRIHIGPYLLVLQDNSLILADRGDNIRLDAQNLIREVTNKQGKKIRILNNISLPIEPGQFVALVGGSGAGKSTLMGTLLGINPTTSGTVYLNGEELRSNFNIYRTQIGYVPQNDIVHKNLRVREVLTYAAKLRLPPDADLEAIVNKTLTEIEMSQRQDVLVKNLSGGQLKRVSIGVELLADPKLFFLDEPTSGLDPGLDKKMMELLQNLAKQGRTIIIVTHATSNITLCDRLVFLGFGGNLCYFGLPTEAMKFFQIQSEDFADIYIKLENQESVEQQASKYLNSHYYQDFIARRLSTDHLGKQQQKPQQVKPSFFRQLLILTQRYSQLTLRDPINLILSLITAPIGIALIILVNQNQNPFISDIPLLALKVLFVFTSSSIWIGLSSSLQEIIKESAIYMRERLVNLGLLPYLFSKIIVLAGLGLAQTLLMLIVILLGFQPPENDLIPWFLGVGITTFLSLFTSMNLGLMISSLVKNESQANNALPLLLIPQIIFSGVLFEVEGISKFISWLMLSRWSVGAYSIIVDVNGLVAPPPILPDGTTISLPFEGSSAHTSNLDNLLLNWILLLLHSLVYFIVTLLIQKNKDIFK